MSKVLLQGIVLLCTVVLSNAGVPSAETGSDYQGIVSSAENETILMQVVTNWIRTNDFKAYGMTRVYRAGSGEEIWHVPRVLGPVDELYLSPDGNSTLWIRRKVVVPKDSLTAETTTPIIKIYRRGELLKELTLGDIAFFPQRIGEFTRYMFLHSFGSGSVLLRDGNSSSMAITRENVMTSTATTEEPVFENQKVSFTLLDNRRREIDLKTGGITIQGQTQK